MRTRFLEYGTRAGALKGWATRRANMRNVSSPRVARSIGRTSLGASYSKVPRGQRYAVSSQLLTKTGRVKSERQVAAVLQKHGLLKSAKMGLGVGLKTETGTVKHTLMSNNKKHIYTGSTLGMRQRLLAWHRSLGDVLPSGFENWSPAEIEKMFLRWNANNADTYRRRIGRYTHAVEAGGRFERMLSRAGGAIGGALGMSVAGTAANKIGARGENYAKRVGENTYRAGIAKTLASHGRGLMATAGSAGAGTVGGVVGYHAGRKIGQLADKVSSKIKRPVVRAIQKVKRAVGWKRATRALKGVERPAAHSGGAKPADPPKSASDSADVFKNRGML